MSKSVEPPVFSPDDFHSYLASRRRISPERLRIPTKLIMTFHRNMFDSVRRRIHGHFLDWYYARRLAVGSLKGANLAVLHSFVGSPAASMMLEEMIASGARQVVEVGMCGGLAPSVQVGDIIVVDEAFVDEGTSSHYFDDPRRFSTSSKLTEVIRRTLKHTKVAHKTGGVWTTDAVYRETRTKLARFRGLGAVAVNMESSALFAVARYRGVDIGSLQVVSDLVGEKDWKPSFHEKRVQRQSMLASDAAIDALQMV